MIEFKQIYNEILHDHELIWNNKEIYDYFIKNNLPVLNFKHIKHRAIDEWRKQSQCVPYTDFTEITKSFVEDQSNVSEYDASSILDFELLVQKVLAKIAKLPNQPRFKLKIFKMFWAYIVTSVPDQALRCKHYFHDYIDPKEIELNNKLLKTRYDIESFIGYKSDFISLNTGFGHCLKIVQNIIREVAQEEYDNSSGKSNNLSKFVDTDNNSTETTFEISGENCDKDNDNNVDNIIDDNIPQDAVQLEFPFDTVEPDTNTYTGQNIDAQDTYTKNMFGGNVKIRDDLCKADVEKTLEKEEKKSENSVVCDLDRKLVLF